MVGSAQRRTMATNHADASGLTSSNPWAGVDGDGATELALAAPSQGQDAVRRLGSPTHIGCCPTGTLEVTSGASKKECGNAIEATVAALTRNLSTTPPKFLILSGSLRPESYSRKLAVECGRLLANYGCEAKVYDARVSRSSAPAATTHRIPKYSNCARSRVGRKAWSGSRRRSTDACRAFLKIRSTGSRSPREL